VSTLERAIALAAEKHAGQLDKAKAPYILHPLRVMLGVETLEEKMAAVLHDVVEDTDVTLADLAAEGFSPAVVRAVDALTRRKGEDYMDFVRRAGADPVARRVKLADLADNMDLSRLPNPGEADNVRLEKYRRARTLLLAPTS
jgi:guanosine-3',5'-bis(diphosphate) 3'-pyrophosphohydrolase